MNMKKRMLAQNMEVSSLGFGCMGLSHAYGEAMEEKEAILILQQAYETGYTLFDTAQCYVGYTKKGHISYNEELVGKAFHDKRDKVTIISKFGVIHTGNEILTDSLPSTIYSSIDESLTKLNTSYIDLYFQHRIDPSVPPETVALVMKDLIKMGKIRAWGVSEANEDYIRRAHAICPISSIENRYSMMYRDYESLFPVLEELGISFVAFSPLANGFLTDSYNKDSTFSIKDDYRSFMPQFQKEAYDQNQELLGLIRRLAREKKATPASISLAWMLNKKPYIIPIPGSRKEERIKENAFADTITLSQEEVKSIDKALDTMKMSMVFGGHKVVKNNG